MIINRLKIYLKFLTTSSSLVNSTRERYFLCRSGGYDSRYVADLDDTSENRRLKKKENN